MATKCRVSKRKPPSRDRDVGLHRALLESGTALQHPESQLEDFLQLNVVPNNSSASLRLHVLAVVRGLTLGGAAERKNTLA